jgi:hypothetical protein
VLDVMFLHKDEEGSFGCFGATNLSDMGVGVSLPMVSASPAGAGCAHGHGRGADEPRSRPGSSASCATKAC